MKQQLATIEGTQGVTGITISEHPTLSIIIPTYNRLSTLRRCIQNIRANVSVSHELIIVEGGSTDGTREFLARHNRLRIIHEAERQGAAPARDKGFRAARGQYVMWLDDRAYPLRGSVESAIAELRIRARITCSFGTAVILSAAKNLAVIAGEILRCAQDDDKENGQVISARILRRSDEVGMVGFYDDSDCSRTVRDSVQNDGGSYRIYDAKGHVFANFGLASRTVLANIGYTNSRSIGMARAAHPSLRIQLELGLRIVGCRGALVHYQRPTEQRPPEFRPPLSRDAQEAVTGWNTGHADETLQAAFQPHASDELQLA